MLLLFGCATRPEPGAPPPQTTARPPIGPGAATRAAERTMLNRYTRERDCAGAAYARAHDYAVARMNELASAPTETGHISQAMANGQFRVRLAEVAAHKKCAEVARTTYGEIMTVFTGPPYAGLRRRAMNGLKLLDRAEPAARQAPAPAPTGPAQAD